MKLLVGNGVAVKNQQNKIIITNAKKKPVFELRKKSAMPPQHTSEGEQMTTSEVEPANCHCSCHITQSSAGPCSHCQPLIELLRKYGKSMEKEMATLALATFY